MSQKVVNENHSLSYLLNKQSKRAIASSTSIQLNHSRELFSLYMNDYFRLNLDGFDDWDSNGDEYRFLYSKNISLLLRRYVYNVLCSDIDTKKAYVGKNIIYLNLEGEPLFKGLEYTRTSNAFIENCYFILKQRAIDLGFKDESFNKTLKNYLYGKATPLGSNLKTKIAFYLGMSIENLDVFLDCLEITRKPTSYKEEIALSLLANENDYYENYQKYQQIIKENISNKNYYSNNQLFVQLVKTEFDLSIDDKLYELGIDVEKIIKKKKDQDMIFVEDEWSQYLLEFKNDILDDTTLKNIKKNNIPVKKKHILLFFFYKCLIHHDQYFMNGNHKEIIKYFIKPCNEVLDQYGFAQIDYSLYFDKFLLLCLVKQNPVFLFNKILVNAQYDLRRRIYG